MVGLRSCDFVGDLNHTVLVLLAMFGLYKQIFDAIGQTGYYIGITSYCLSIFKLGLVFGLFSWVMQSRLAKSIASSISQIVC